MLTEGSFDEWSKDLGLTREAELTIRAIRAAQPSRRVTNVAGNFCGWFPSKKMGCAVQWESASIERAALLIWEADDSVHEVYDQVARKTEKYLLPNGKSTRTWTSLDYFLLKRKWVGGVDCKTSSELRELVARAPNRWIQTGPQSWDQPPLRKSLENSGLGYQVITEYDLPHTLCRNVEFLRPRLMQNISIPANAQNSLTKLLAVQKRIHLTEAITIAGNVDFIYQGHFFDHWFLPLRHEPLGQPDCACLYQNSSVFEAFRALSERRVGQILDRVVASELPANSIAIWNGEKYALHSQDGVNVYLQCASKPLVMMAISMFQALLDASTIIVPTHQRVSSKEGLDVLLKASNEDIAEAVRKNEIFRRLENGEERSDLGIPARTLHAWQANFRIAETEFGNGFLGLIPKNRNKGNCVPRTSESEREALRSSLAWLSQPIPRPVTAGYAHYLALCEKGQIESRSEKSFLDRWEKRDRHESTEDREGKRAAYPEKSPRITGGPHLEQGPPEGDSPFSRVHIDHVQSNVFVRRMNALELLGKPWITIAIDAYTRLILAMWLSIMSPSHVSVLMVLRDLVRRHGRLPMFTITDGGKDFRSEIVASFLAQRGCEHGIRPNGEPRFGNPVERLNLDFDNHLAKNIHGGNTVLRTPRMSSPTHDPRDLAYNTVPMLAETCSDFFFGLYPDTRHGGLNATPNDMIRSARVLQGSSWGIPATVDDAFMFQTLCLPHKHGGLVRMRDGIALNGHNYFSEDMVGGTSSRMKHLPRYDPEDPTYIMAQLNGVWTKCTLIDSQLRRLPPEGHRRYYLSERVFLRQQTSRRRDDDLLARGRKYLELEAQRESIVQEAQNEPKRPPDPVADVPVTTAKTESLGISPAPISHRSDAGE